MTKGELIEKIAAGARLSQAQAHAALTVFLKTTSNALKKGDKVKLVDFGTFCVTRRAERKGRHPKDGSLITIEARKVVRFKPGSTLSKKVR